MDEKRGRYVISVDSLLGAEVSNAGRHMQGRLVGMVVLVVLVVVAVVVVGWGHCLTGS